MELAKAVNAQRKLCEDLNKIDFSAGVVAKSVEATMNELNMAKLNKYYMEVVGGKRQNEALKAAGLSMHKYKTLKQKHKLPSPFKGDGLGYQYKAPRRKVEENQTESNNMRRSSAKRSASGVGRSSSVAASKGGTKWVEEIPDLRGSEFINKFKNSLQVNESDETIESECLDN